MNADEALKFVEQLLLEREKRLNDLQRVMFRGAWEGKSSKKIYQECSSRCTYQHLIQNVGPELWRLLSDVVGDRVSKRNLQGPIEGAKEQRSQLQPITALETRQSYLPELESNGKQENLHPFGDELNSPLYLGNVPEVSSLFGRFRELEQLKELIRFAGCRLIVLYGAPGIGKTTLTAKLAQQVSKEFEYVVWRSLEDLPTLPALTATLTQFLSNGTETSTEISRLLHYLQQHRCLIVLDEVESVLRSGVHNGSYRQGYEGYGELLQQVGQVSHQSCIVLTSWEKPKDVANMEDEQRVFTLKLEGLGELATRDFLVARGADCTDTDSRVIIHRYDGNPFALNSIATKIRDLFNGNIQTLLADLQQGTVIFDDLQDLLDRQFNRLSELERAIVECLVTHHEPLSMTEIIQSVTHPISYVEVQEVLQSLLRRSLIEGSAAGYSLQTLMTEYVMNRGLK